MNPNERTIEYSFLFENINEHAPRNFLDVGTGKTAVPALVKACGIDVVAIDKNKAQCVENPCTRGGYCSFKIIHDDFLTAEFKQKFDMISCISVLEHVTNYNQFVGKMSEILSDNGVIILTFPYNEHKYIPNAYKLKNAGYGQNEPDTNICQMYSREQLSSWEKKYNLKVVKQEYWQAFSGEYWTCGKRMYPPVASNKDKLHQLTCLTLKKA